MTKGSIIAESSSVIAVESGFVYPAGRIANYLLDGDTVNTLGANATNNGGTFVTDPEGERGTVWQGNDSSDYISDVLNNDAGTFWSATQWFNSSNLVNIRHMFGSSDGADEQIKNNDASTIRIAVGGVNISYSFPTMSNDTWYNLGISLEQSGSDVLGRLYINGIESTSGEQTFASVTIGKFDLIGTQLATFWGGEFSITNIFNTLLTPTEFLGIHNEEVLP